MEHSSQVGMSGNDPDASQKEFEESRRKRGLSQQDRGEGEGLGGQTRLVGGVGRKFDGTVLQEESRSDSEAGGDIQFTTTTFDQGGGRVGAFEEGRVEKLRQQVDNLQAKLKEAESSRIASWEALAAAEADAAHWAERAQRAEEQLSRAKMLPGPTRCLSGSPTFTFCSSDSSSPRYGQLSLLHVVKQSTYPEELLERGEPHPPSHFDHYTLLI